MESENFKILWDFTIQCDRKIEARRRSTQFLSKQYPLSFEIAKVWHMRNVIVLPVVIGALGAVSVNFKEYMKRIGVKVRLKVIQKTALLGTAKILRKVLSL